MMRKKSHISKKIIIPSIIAAVVAVAFLVMGVIVNHSVDKMAEGYIIS